MSIDSPGVDNEVFYEPEDGYWEGLDRLSFEASTMVDEWPVPSNPFVRRMAKASSSDHGLHALALGDFQEVVGALIEAEPSASYRFLVVPQTRNAGTVSVKLLKTFSHTPPPLRADNIGSLALAFAWMARRAACFEVSCAADASYWIHRR